MPAGPRSRSAWPIADIAAPPCPGRARAAARADFVPVVTSMNCVRRRYASAADARPRELRAPPPSPRRRLPRRSSMRTASTPPAANDSTSARVERPRRAVGRLRRARGRRGEHEQRPARRDRPGDRRDRPRAHARGQRLDGDALDDEVERAGPFARRVEQVGDDVVDRRVREALAREPDRASARCRTRPSRSRGPATCSASSPRPRRRRARAARAPSRSREAVHSTSRRTRRPAVPRHLALARARRRRRAARTSPSPRRRRSRARREVVGQPEAREHGPVEERRHGADPVAARSIRWIEFGRKWPSSGSQMYVPNAS